ncbi:MAG: family 10 glycosylhydrolase, partial [Verrucomicrobiota bacterium]
PGNSGKGKIFDTHPDWVATKNDGTQIDSSSFYWMTHARPEVQQFLINLAREVVANYDLDGIEFDRIRYSSLAYGYDDFTKSLYQSEKGVLPPAQTNDVAWIRWRADKLNQFVADAYDALKALNPQFLISSAPSAYGSSSYTAYNSFCQDWVWWINSNKLDQVEVQSYFSTANSFSNVLNFIGTQVLDKQKVFPSFAINPNSVYLDSAEVVKFPAVTRAQGFGGNAIWYYVPLTTSNYFTALRTNVYQTNTPPPQRASDWREHRAITLISDSANAVRTGSWPPSAYAGYSGPSCYAQTGAGATIDYFFDVPVAGKYEVYAHTISATSRTTAAEHRVFDSMGNTFTNFINQNDANNAGWYKIGDYLLDAGRHNVVQLSNRGLTGNQLVSGDAMMILLNRRLSAPLKLIPPAHRTNAEPFRFSITGATGQKINIASSSNFLSWTSLSNLTLTNSASEFSEPYSNGPKTFRARLSP